MVSVRGPTSRRMVVPWLLLAAVLVLAAGAAAVGLASRQTAVKTTTPPTVDAPPTGFGGYHWPGTVNKIQADWRVPTITNTPQFGAEATWIGAQGRSADEPFIQLGTTGSVSANQTSGYEVFWSDTARGFRPIPIVGLRHPGDLIQFKMVRVSEGWRLSVKNLTYGWGRSVTIAYGQRDTFSEGEWTQEDPAAGYSDGTDLPYAETSPVSFQQVLVNGKAPHLRYADEGALSTQNGVYLVPTPMTHDGFSLVPPTGFALQYLTDAQQVDSSLVRIGAETSLTYHAEGKATPAQVRELHEIALLYLASANKVEAQSWPRSVHPEVSRFVTTQDDLASALSAWTGGTEHSLHQLDAIFDDSSSPRAVGDLRRDLGLPSI